MDLSTLKPAPGSTRDRKRVGRGPGSGMGGTSTRGHKGAKQRSGYSRKIGFEGGQMPLQRRVPKFGFKNINRVEYQVVNLDDLQTLAEKYNLTRITIDDLFQTRKIRRNSPVKVLGRGELNVKLDVEANAFSASAIAAIEAQGGTATVVNDNDNAYQIVTLKDLRLLSSKLNSSKITLEDLYATGLKREVPVKVTGRGELDVKLEVEANAFSGSAIAAIKALGGSVLKV